MKKVLLVEDDPFIRDLTSIKLTQSSYAVSVAADGESVIDMVKEEHPDVILLDLDLPGLSGLDVLAQLKADEKYTEIPVIIFSNNDDAEIKKKASDLGMAGFFIKASTAFEDLLTRIQEITN